MDKKKKLLFDLLGLIGAGALVTIDQVTKSLVMRDLTDGKEIVVLKGIFKIVSHKNTGAVWGILSGKTDVLSIVTVFIIAAVLFMYFRIPWQHKRLRALKWICLFLTSGAIGNLIDRVQLKYVVDFLYFELIDFPVFNVADCYITMSMIVLIILIVFYYKDEDFEVIWPKKS